MAELFLLDRPNYKIKYYLFDDPKGKFSGEVYDIDKYKISQQQEASEELVVEKKVWGKEYGDLNLGLTSAYYINERFVNCLRAVGESNFQLIPTIILPEEKQYYLLNILNVVDCVDKEQSRFDLWTEEDDHRPDLLGEFKTIYKMVLDRSKVPKNVHIFRLENYTIKIIITRELAEELKKNNMVGFTLKPVG